MDEIKFRYVFKKPNGHIIKYITDIQHLEHGDISNFLEYTLVSIERDLLSRDLYTERKDSKGTEIYGGDIVQWRWYGRDKIKGELLKAAVEWDAFLLQWHATPNALCRLSGDDSELEVIGNIWENPRLLEVKG